MLGCWLVTIVVVKLVGVAQVVAGYTLEVGAVTIYLPPPAAKTHKRESVKKRIR